MRLDYLSLIGVLVSLAAILGGQWLEGGSVNSLLQVAAFLIVIGGTLGATLLQHSTSTFLRGARMLGWVFSPPYFDSREQMNALLSWSAISRKGGLLALENVTEHLDDPFVRKGLEMVIDGHEPSAIRQALELELEMEEDMAHKAARVWESAGGYAPTVGILGAVLGLIHVMENLSDPAKLGGGIAVAFVATIYGVGLANLFFLPVANKLKVLVSQQMMRKEMMIDGLVGIASGDNPRLIESRLSAYLAPEKT